MSLREKTNNSIGNSVYLSIKKNILDLNLTPGTLVSAQELSTKLGVSRSPVRESIIRLNEEGLVDIIPQVGTMISKIDLKRVHEERFIRESLEEKVLIKFLNIATEENINWLYSNLEEQKIIFDKKDFVTFMELDDNFHSYFFEITKMHISSRIIQNFSGHYRRIRMMTVWDSLISEGIIVQHANLIESIVNKNLDSLIEAIHIHCGRINNEVLVVKERYPDFFLEEEVIGNNFLKNDFLNNFNL